MCVIKSIIILNLRRMHWRTLFGNYFAPAASHPDKLTMQISPALRSKQMK